MTHGVFNKNWWFKSWLFLVFGLIFVSNLNWIDQLARRGTKRPFSTSTEDELNQQSQEQLNESFHRPPSRHTHTQLSPSLISPSGKRGLGDQLKELLHQWGHKQSGFLLKCYACGLCSSSPSSTILHLSSFVFSLFITNQSLEHVLLLLALLWYW